MLKLYMTGIGAAVARAFAAAGCEKIAITDLNDTTLEQTKKAIAASHPNVQLLLHPGDVANDRFAESFISKVVGKFGRVDYAVNCAGVLGIPMRSDETSLAEFDRVNNINYRGCWLSSRAQLTQMIKQDPLPSHDPARPGQRGAVVNIASQLGVVSRPNARKFAQVLAALLLCDASGLTEFYSCILRSKVCHNRHDPCRRDRLLKRQHSSKLRLSRGD